MYIECIKRTYLKCVRTPPPGGEVGLHRGENISKFYVKCYIHIYKIFVNISCIKMYIKCIKMYRVYKIYIVYKKMYIKCVHTPPPGDEVGVQIYQNSM